jgi:glycosyltransferase involved in cell wall biosynthesis
LPPDRVVAAGEGIDLTLRGDGSAFRARRGLRELLLAYSGRADLGKNIPLLLGYLREYWARRGTPLKLLRTGRDPMQLPPALSEIVLDLGDVSVQERQDAYAAADLFVHPSVHESFSIVLMEAWLQGTPALVHAGCAVTRAAAEASGGGLWFGDFGEFAAALDLLLGDAELREVMGERGRAYVLETCRWEDVARKTVEAIVSDI